MRIADLCVEHLGIAADWWWVHDYLAGTMTVSGSVTSLLGYEPEEINTLRAWEQIIHEADFPEVEASMQNAFRTMSAVQTRIRFRTKGGRWRTMLCRMKPYPEDVPTAILGIGREIDDVLAIEQEILLRNEDLAQVASVLSHDFRGPARHITGCTEKMMEQIGDLQGRLVEGGSLDFTALKSWARLASKSAHRLGKMIEHVLQYSRAGTEGIEPENIDSAFVVGDIIRDYADRIAEKNVEIRLSSLPQVHYDPTMLYLVLANLISNAIKFSKKNDPNPIVEVEGHSSSGSWATITVRDRGIGFDERHQEKILNMGFRLHHESDYAGFGYGLAIVSRILRRAGGDLSVRSQVGRGAEFVLRIPAPQRTVRL